MNVVGWLTPPRPQKGSLLTGRKAGTLWATLFHKPVIYANTVGEEQTVKQIIHLYL
jgi:hypothetical protein